MPLKNNAQCKIVIGTKPHCIVTVNIRPAYIMKRYNAGIMKTAVHFKQLIDIGLDLYLMPLTHTPRPLYNFSASSSHRAAEASEGMRQSARGESETEPTFTPSGMQLRLNCCEKKRR